MFVLPNYMQSACLKNKLCYIAVTFCRSTDFQLLAVIINVLLLVVPKEVVTVAVITTEEKMTLTVGCEATLVGVSARTIQ